MTGTTNAHGSAKIDLSALSDTELKTVESVAEKHARLDRLDSMTDSALTTTFGVLRMLSCVDRIAVLADLKLRLAQAREGS
jgi:hypothetical protein